MANFLLKLGSFALPPTFYVEDLPTNRNVPSLKLPRANGARQILGYFEGKTFQVKGSLAGNSEPLPTPGGTLRQQADALKAACNSGVVNFQAYDDRYWRNCQVSSFAENYDPTGFERYCDISFEVMTGDPFQYETAAQTAARSITASGQALTATVGGTADTLPLYALTVGTGGVLSAQVAIDTTLEYFTLKGTVTAGEVLLIDALNKTVTRQSDGVTRIALLDGLFARLSLGANIVTLTYTSGGATISNLALTWANRWW